MSPPRRGSPPLLTSTSQDDRYLTPRINQVVKEDDERTLYDTMSVEKRK
jgi:hypothetical protein